MTYMNFLQPNQIICKVNFFLYKVPILKCSNVKTVSYSRNVHFKEKLENCWAVEKKVHYLVIFQIKVE